MSYDISLMRKVIEVEKRINKTFIIINQLHYDVGGYKQVWRFTALTQAVIDLATYICREFIKKESCYDLNKIPEILLSNNVISITGYKSFEKILNIYRELSRKFGAELMIYIAETKNELAEASQTLLYDFVKYIESIRKLK